MLLQVNEQRNILHEISKRKANWIGHILCRNCLIRQVIEGKIKGEAENVRSCWMTLGKGEDMKEEPLNRTLWRNRFGGGIGPVIGQTVE